MTTKKDNYYMSNDFVEQLDNAGRQFKGIVSNRSFSLSLSENDKCRNFIVAEILGRLFNIILDNSYTYLGCVIDVEKKSIHLRWGDSAEKIEGDCTGFSLTKYKFDKLAKLSDMYVECLIDIWLRHGVKIFHFAVKGNNVDVLFGDISVNTISQYLKSDVYLGWNPHGDFFSRSDWMKSSHMDSTVGSGKAVLKKVFR